MVKGFGHAGVIKLIPCKSDVSSRFIKEAGHGVPASAIDGFAGMISRQCSNYGAEA